MAALSRSYREHVFEENSVLHPGALRVIQGDDVWSRKEEERDAIGYGSASDGAAPR